MTWYKSQVIFLPQISCCCHADHIPLLTLFLVQVKISHRSMPWAVIAFEPHPLMQPILERCAIALSSGLPVPELPFPPSGSSSHLAHYAPQYNCTHWRGGLQRDCIFNQTWYHLAALRSHPNLTSLAAVLSRRRAVKQMTCRNNTTMGNHFRKNDEFLLVPAAVGVRDGMLELHTAFDQLLRGGAISLPEYKHRTGLWGNTEHLNVPVINFTAMLEETVTEADAVYVKMVCIRSNPSRHVPPLIYRCIRRLAGHRRSRTFTFTRPA